MICKYSGATNIKYKKQFPRLLTLQTSADALVRFANIKEAEDISSKNESRKSSMNSPCDVVIQNAKKPDIFSK